MGILSEIESAFNLLKKIGELKNSWNEQNLSPLEEDMLCIAEQNGNCFMVVDSADGGLFVFAGQGGGQKCYRDENDDLVAKEAVEALAKLIVRDLAKPKNSEATYFELTADGIRKARSLSSNSC